MRTSLLTMFMVLSMPALAGDAVVTLPDQNKAFVVLGEGAKGWITSSPYRHVCHMGFVYLYVPGGTASSLSPLYKKDTITRPVPCKDYQAWVNTQLGSGTATDWK